MTKEEKVDKVIFYWEKKLSEASVSDPKIQKLAFKEAILNIEENEHLIRIFTNYTYYRNIIILFEIDKLQIIKELVNSAYRNAWEDKITFTKWIYNNFDLFYETIKEDYESRISK